MFQMMNEARIGVGMGAVMLGYAGYLYSLEYARERPQAACRTADPKRATVAIIRHADVRRMLLTQKAYVEGALTWACTPRACSTTARPWKTTNSAAKPTTCSTC